MGHVKDAAKFFDRFSARLYVKFLIAKKTRKEPVKKSLSVKTINPNLHL